MKVAVPILLGISATTSTSLNSIVLYVFAKLGIKNITFKDVFMVSMTVGDLFQSLLGYSLEIYSMGETQGGKKKSEIGINFCKVISFQLIITDVLKNVHLVKIICVSLVCTIYFISFNVSKQGNIIHYFKVDFIATVRLIWACLQRVLLDFISIFITLSNIGCTAELVVAENDSDSN